MQMSAEHTVKWLPGRGWRVGAGLGVALLAVALAGHFLGQPQSAALAAVTLAALWLAPWQALALGVAGAGVVVAQSAQVHWLDAVVMCIVPVLVSAVRRTWLRRPAAPAAPGVWYRAAVDAAVDGVLVLETDGSVLAANDAACVLLGVARDALPAFDSPTCRRGVPVAPIMALLGAPAPHARRFETELKRADGGRYRAEICVHRGDFDGRPVVLACVRDVSARHADTQARELHHAQLAALLSAQSRDLAAARDNADRANHAKDRFVANVSHELRTPLHAVLAFASLALRLGPGNEAPLRKHLVRIRGSAEELGAFVDDLTLLTALQSGEWDLSMRKVDLAGLVSSLVQRMAEPLAARGQRLETQIQVRGGVMMDAGLVERLLLALLTHASRRSPTGAHLVLRMRCQSGRRCDGAAGPGIAVQVCDAGEALSEARLVAVFDPLGFGAQVDAGTDNPGLQLAICRQIVDRHGGEISARNAEAGGVVFALWLPVEPADAAHAAGVETVRD